MTSKPPRVTVVGSINMDLVVRCEELPRPGQTIMAQSMRQVGGGKGANQAVAAARAGAQVTLVGRVGDDVLAGQLKRDLLREQINCDHVLATSDCSSGVAVVAVEDSGQNAILVVPGANGRVEPEDVLACRQLIEASDVLLVQLEIPLAAVLTAIDVARQAGVRVILDPAPAPAEVPPQLLGVDLVCPNQSEAATLTAHPASTDVQVEQAARELQALGAENVAITLGERGSFFWDGENSRWIKPFPVSVVDTTAAGDAFAAALAVFWAEQDNLVRALEFASAAGALSASRAGAQTGLPFRAEIEALSTSLR